MYGLDDLYQAFVSDYAGAGYMLFYVAFIVLQLASYWILLSKAGQPGWGALIPIYNFYLVFKVGGRPGWWLLLMLIPVVNAVIALIALYSFIKAFGKDGIGSFLLALFFGVIYFPYLAFSKNVHYQRHSGTYGY